MARKTAADPVAPSPNFAPAMALHGRAAELFQDIQQRYVLDACALGILRSAAEALQRSDEAAQLVSRDGLCVRDRHGCWAKHPAALLERDFRAQAILALQKLGLNLEG